MAFWTTFRDQMLALWNRWTIAQRAGFSAATLACFGAIFGTLFWASQPDYVVIASQLTPQRSAEIVGVLDTEKIAYQLNFSGSAVSVASGDVATARLALRNELNTGDAVEDNEISNPLLPGSPRSEADRRRRAQERQVAQQIEKLRGIAKATVTISQPDPTPFAVEQSVVTASVVLEPRPGSVINFQVAQSALSLIARGVPGLQSENITLTDSLGNRFNSSDGPEAALGWQLQHKSRFERDLELRAETLLQSAQGVRAAVRVSADIDFSEQTRTSNTYDPEARATRSEFVITNKQEPGIAPPVGVPGTATNLPDNSGNGTSTGGKSTNQEIKTEYEPSSVNEVVRNLPGKILRLSVSAIVDVQPPAPSAAGAPGTPATASATALQQTQIEDIIKGVVGFDPARNDEIHIVLAPMTPMESVEPVSTGFLWEQWQPLLQSVSLGLAATLAFLIGMMLMKRMKPIVITQTVGPGIPLADARRLASISEQAKAHPDVVASILAAWLNEQEQPEVRETIVPTERAAGRSSSVPSPPGGASIPKSAVQPPGAGGEGGRKAA